MSENNSKSISDSNESSKQPRKIDYSKLGILRSQISKDIESFDIETFRFQSYDASLRD